jgi:hypothetical protein
VNTFQFSKTSEAVYREFTKRSRRSAERRGTAG